MNWFSTIGSLLILIVGGFFWYESLKKEVDNIKVRTILFIAGLPIVWFLGWLIIVALMVGYLGG